MEKRTQQADVPTTMQREKKIAVLGLARAGVPAARFLASRGAQVVGFDGKARDQLSADVLELENEGVELRVGDATFANVLQDEYSMLVLSPGLKIHHEPLKSVLAQAHQRGAEIIGELELASRHCAAPIIAVTGTKGKSTTVKLIEEMLRAAGLNAIRCGNTGTPLIAELPNLSADSWAIVEVSSFQLETATTFKPRVAALLNLLPDHQDYHPDLEQYWATKLKLLARQNAGDTAIFNVDDERVQSVVSGNEDWSGRVPPNDDVAFWTSSAQHDTNCLWRRGDVLGVRVGENDIPIINVNEIALRGAHNVGNVACALACVTAVLGDRVLEVAGKLADVLRNFESLPHRLEIVGVVNGVTFINDSQATIPEAAIKALQSFPAPVVLIAGGLAKLENTDAYDELGANVVKYATALVTIGRDGNRIADAARRAGAHENDVIEAGELAAAFKIAFQRAQPDGNVVFSPACASFDQFANYEERGQKFRDLVSDLRNASYETHHRNAS